MGPEMHYQLIQERVTELHEIADAHRLALEAQKGRKGREGRERSSHRLQRMVFGKLRLS
ncbi:hypothetical protein [Streptosporangium sp. KLBMP 9127]|nr:hypothetical protein [Streptosporangium sp. KLBMP 9127]